MRKIIFWILTALFCAGMLFSGFSEFRPEGIAAIVMLGYPAYLSPFLGVAKILGVLAILCQRRFPRLAEWAYAGFAFDFIGAGYSMYMTGAGAASLTVLPFIAVLVAIYCLRPGGCGCGSGCGCCKGGCTCGADAKAA